MTKETETAQDLCQETFIRWFNMKNAAVIDRPDAWLKKVLTNLAYNHFRHQKVRSQWETDCEDERLEGRVSMESDITRLEVEDVLSSLPWKEQVLLKMRLADMSYREMAETLNVSIGSVGTMLARAMQKFKQAYTGKELEGKNEMPGSRQNSVVSRRPTGS